MDHKLIGIMQVLCALSCFVQFLEYWSLRRFLQMSAAKENFFAHGSVLNAVLLLGLASSLGLFFDVRFSLVLFGCYYFINSILRSSFNGGSDYMTILVLLGLCVAALFPHHEVWQRMALLYIGVQAVFSYFIAGIVKAKKRKWWSGQAISEILGSVNYSIPIRISQFSHRTELMKWGGLGILAFELSFPLALVNSSVLWVYLGLALSFHFLNFYIFGLNRFFWSWLASFPAIVFLSSTIVSL